MQDLVLRAHTLRYRRERWLTPDGETVTAALPPAVTGHFGPALRRFLLAQYHQGQVTVARLVDQVRATGIDISKRHLVRLLIDGQDLFRNEARDVLRAGLETARWITVDDTGARHKSRNGFCTQIGNDDFTQVSAPRDRRAGSTSSNACAPEIRTASSTMRPWPICASARCLARPSHCWPITPSGSSPTRQPGWVHLQALGLTDLKVLPRPCRYRHRGGALGLHHGAWLPMRGRGGEATTFRSLSGSPTGLGSDR